MAILRRKPSGVRWGKVSELDRRIRVATSAFKAQPRRLHHLSAFRAMHVVAPGHMPVRMSGTRIGIRPSSNMSIPQKVAFVQKRNE